MNRIIYFFHLLLTYFLINFCMQILMGLLHFFLDPVMYFYLNLFDLQRYLSNHVFVNLLS
jgi:hypothetical protein